MRKKGIALEHGVHRALVRRNIRDVLTVYADLSLVRLAETGEKAEHRGLAAAGRAEDGHEFTSFDIDAYVVKDHFISKAFGDVLYLDYIVVAVHFQSGFRLSAKFSEHVFCRAGKIEFPCQADIEEIVTEIV